MKIKLFILLLIVIGLRGYGQTNSNQKAPVSLMKIEVELEKTSFIVLAPDCSDIDKLLICIDEIKTRKAHITVITDNNTLFKDRKIDCLMEIPKMNFFSSLLCLYPIH